MAWVGGGDSQRTSFQFNLGEEAEPGCISQQGLAQTPSVLSRENALGFGFLVPCFSEQHKTGRKNSSEANTGSMYSFMA